MACSGARAWAALAVASVTTLVCADARGGDRSDFGVFGVDAYATSWSKPPSLLIQGSDAPAHIAGLASPPGSATTAGVGADLSLRLDGLLYEVLRLRYTQAYGQPLYGVQTADESPFRVTQGPVQIFELGSAIPIGASGFGGQLVGRSFKVKLFTDWGIAWAWANASVRDPSNTRWSSQMTMQSICWRAELSACARVGRSWPSEAVSWACLTAGTNLYEFDWLSGSSLGLRMDL
jgi:hypothetical protein